MFYIYQLRVKEFLKSFLQGINYSFIFGMLALFL